MSNSPHQNTAVPDDDSARDIPPARRQPAEVSLADIEKASKAMRLQPKRTKSGLTVGLLLVAGLVGLGLWQWPQLSPRVEGMKEAIAAGNFRKNKNTPASTDADSPRAATPEPAAEPTLDPSLDPSNTIIIGSTIDSATDSAAAPTTDPTDSLSSEPQKPPETLLNHRRYETAPASELVPLNANSTLKLRSAAQQSVTAMIAKAKSEGVQLGIVSGFRTLEDQDYLYFKVKAERGQSARTRAEVSAPPGYSEHHTGYAVDLIDESRPETHVEESFETTPAYQWLEKNAAFFNFEMSFPKDNESSVKYEPWHWRYVGDQNSLETFYAP